jgi:gliding motility-associated-like protein
LEDSALTNIDIVSNDTDVEGDTLTLTVATTDGSGTVSVNADGVSVDYTPAANFNGTETITYTVSDGELSDTTGTLTITVTAVNDAPVAIADTASVAEDTALMVDVISNDTDVDVTDTLTLITAIADGFGTVSVNADGVSVDYTPAANFNGTETITYIVSDGTDTSTGTLTITVTAVNDAPVAVSDTATVLEDSALTNINVVSNDTDVEGDTLTLTVATTDGSGTVSVNADGLSVDYTPAANFDGIEVITYAVSDGVDSDDTGILTITVTAIPEAPVAVSDIATLLEDADLTSVNVVSNDTDIDGDSLTLIEVNTDGTGTVTVNTDGVSVDYTPASNFNGTEIVTYIVSDGLLIDQGTLTLTITPVNDPPVAVSDTATLLEDSALTSIDVILNDMDVEGDTLMLIAATTDGSGTVAVNTDGVSVDYTPAPNFNGTETITYTVSDGVDTDETGILTIMVTAVNDFPIAIADSATVDEDASLTSIDVISNDTDLDIIDTLTLIAVTTNGSGTIAVNTDGLSVDYTPASNFNGTETITYTLFDGTDTTTGTLTITVTPVNDAPVAVLDSATLSEDSALTSIDVILNDMDVEGDTLMLVAATTDGSGTVAVNTDGVSVDYTPAPNFNGTETITYTVSDGVDTDETGILTIIVTAVNDISIAIADSAIVDEDTPLTSIDVIYNDTDLDIIDTLTLIAVTTDGTGTVAVNTDGVSVDYTPASNFNGTETITYTLFDGTDTTTGTLTIIVTPVNDLPVAVSDTATLLEDSVLTSIDVISNDTDVDIIDTLTLISATTNGSGTIAINADRLSINYTPVADFNGTETITYTVSDGTDTSIGILSIIVIPVNDSPIAVDDTYNVIENNTLISIDIIANDTDVDGDYLTLMTVITDGTGTVAVNTDGVSVDYLPAENFNGTETINYTVSDGELIDEGKLTIIVVPVDDFQLVIPALDFPSFFTPNGDGINDTWNIKWVDTNNYFSSEVYIYNRFGKVVAKLNLNEQGWDGTYNGKTLPSGDYWVTVKLIPVDTDKKIIFKTGNFSLLRR